MDWITLVMIVLSLALAVAWVGVILFAMTVLIWKLNDED